MFFRCNGAAIYSRGANKIPMELLEGRMSDAAHRRLVQSAAEGRMNTLRVWVSADTLTLSPFCLCLPSMFRDTLLTRKYHPSQGGAIWEPESFYDESDARGLLIYHDAQFSWPGVRGTASERDELEYQVARLSLHRA
jgi:beta-galactosidase/beta-glucuronidase